ncbi:hypothetical protein [Motiliproteus sp. MSK22-1]|uniref:hypothetical protein n=1 Tax=Motiliproteus sp. MSK22-1 TaxID=1897630 RepID=UPI00097AC384|nr:hypothetical protein [Motiliproteus sp. MSK22-1]OMH32083.1 hypothetical protein BGP75_15360 [Motiliproteus sp. MSK22-1]
MTNQLLMTLSDIATEAHVRIQQDFKHIDPIVGVSQNMRSSGIPADVMTIDCLKSGKRIILILHDDTPDIISFQFAFRDKDPDKKFQAIPFAELTSQKLYDWISSYFSNAV